MTNTQKSLLSGVAVLSVVGIICKLVGVFFRIPLVWLIGEVGAGKYQFVFPTYNLLLTISSAGLPVAISRTVSALLVKNDPRNAKRVFKSAFYLLSAIGFVMMIGMLMASRFLANSVVSVPDTYEGFVAIAPSVFIVCMLSAFRGFMQGQQNMVPTAISQLIEQVFKVAIALPLTYLGAKHSIAYGAAGALLGTSVTELIALIYMIFVYKKKSPAFNALKQDHDAPVIPHKTLLKQLLLSAIPITLGACIVPLSGFVDSAVLVKRMALAGFESAQAEALYGCYSACVINLINVPTALALAIAMSLVPAISASHAKGDQAGVEKNSTLGLRFSFLIGLPCSVGMSVLALPILQFIFGNSISQGNLQITAELLSVSSLTILLFTVVQSTSGILQGLKKQQIPMYTLMAGVACKIILNYTLIAIPSINIHGAPISSIVCYSVSMLPNLYYVCKYANMKFDWQSVVIRPALATAVMGAVVYVSNRLLPQGRLWLIVEVVLGVAAFCAAAYAFKAVTKEDLSFFKRRK